MPQRRSLAKRVSDTFQVITELDLSHAYERQAGTVTIVVALVVVIVGALLFGPRFVGPPTSIPVVVEFPEVAGLAAGNPVTVLGAKVGRVEAIDLQRQGHVRVTLSVRDRFAPRADAKAQVVALNLMGGRAVAYTPGTAAQLLPTGETITGSPSQALGEQLTALRRQAADLLVGLRRVDRDALGRDFRMVEAAVARSRAAARNFPADTVRVDLEVAFAATDSLLAHVRALLAALPGDSVHVMDTLRVSAGQLMEQVANAQDAFSRVQTSLREGKGTAGRLQSDSALREAIAGVRRSLELLQLKFLGRVPDRTGADTAR